MISRKEVSSRVRSMGISFLSEVFEIKNEFTELLKDFRGNFKVASPLSVLSLVNDEKKKEQKEVVKLFEPNFHIYTRKLVFPENRNIYLEYLSNIPEGYGVLEPVDGCGYSIDDLDNYEGVVTLIFYNDVYVDVKGVFDISTGSYSFNQPGKVATICYNNTYSMGVK